jgi:hypothetical protein
MGTWVITQVPMPENNNIPEIFYFLKNKIHPGQSFMHVKSLGLYLPLYVCIRFRV